MKVLNYFISLQIGTIPETIIQERFEVTTILFQSIPAASWHDINYIFEKIDNTTNSSMHLAKYLRNEVRMRMKLFFKLEISEIYIIQTLLIS